MPDRIDLRHADDLRDVAHRAVAALAGGGLVGLEADGGPIVLGSVTQPGSLDQFRSWWESLAGDSQRLAPTLLLPDPTALADWVDLRSLAARQLPGRVWPGPVRLVCPPSRLGLVGCLPAVASSLLAGPGGGGPVTFQVPDDRLIAMIQGLTPGPLVMGDAAVAAWAALGNSDRPGLILDSGESLALDRLATVVRVDDEGWRVVRPGVVPERTVSDWAGVILLFVCTGNTCRSPMAEALCRVVLARRFGCEPDALGRHGFAVMSAGVATSDGMPAAENAVAVVRVRGGSLDDHQSQRVTADLVRRADHILAMTWDHLDALLDLYPEESDRVRLLDPHGDDIADPVGMDEATYRDTARDIERHLETLLQDLGL